MNGAWRIRFLAGLIFLAALLLAGKLYLVQIVQGKSFIVKADRQYTEAPGVFDRGSIYFTTKDGTLISAATLKSGFTVAINPQLIKDPEAVYRKLKEFLPYLDRADFLARAAKKSATYVEVATKVDEEIG